ncbi:hypothetical protein ACOMHN_014926 [Nucella lapillus]
MAMRCSVCNVTVNSCQQYEQHMVGKTHLKKQRKLAEGEQGSTAGTVQPISFVREGDQNAQQTLPPPSGAQPLSSNSAAAGGPPAPGTNGRDVNTYCDLCMLSLNSKEQAEIHYSGTKHLRKLKLARQHYKEGAETATVGGCKNGTFFCGFCNVTVNSALQMDLHREGSKHRRMVEGIKRHINTANTADTGPPAKRPTPTPTLPANNVPYVLIGRALQLVTNHKTYYTLPSKLFYFRCPW